MYTRAKTLLCTFVMLGFAQPMLCESDPVVTSREAGSLLESRLGLIFDCTTGGDYDRVTVGADLDKLLLSLSGHSEFYPVMRPGINAWLMLSPKDGLNILGAYHNDGNAICGTIGRLKDELIVTPIFDVKTLSLSGVAIIDNAANGFGELQCRQQEDGSGSWRVAVPSLLSDLTKWDTQDRFTIVFKLSKGFGGRAVIDVPGDKIKDWTGSVRFGGHAVDEGIRIEGEERSDFTSIRIIKTGADTNKSVAIALVRPYDSNGNIIGIKTANYGIKKKILSESTITAEEVKEVKFIRVAVVGLYSEVPFQLRVPVSVATDQPSNGTHP